MAPALSKFCFVEALASQNDLFFGEISQRRAIRSYLRIIVKSGCVAPGRYPA
jgi:hypothetical protein